MYLIAYDIAHRKRLYRVAQIMKDYGTRVQRSVFECRLDARRLQQLLGRLKPVLKQREDKVQVYHLCQVCECRLAEYGQGALASEPDVYVC